ncbi:uncharacterized protein LOC107371164 isoform X2 [Tetranychus urticae]|uniref:uncharacterized protein LOC107371164 isoform X2 n=1 Tax=Tetranychus urticae TaxID=32264 RepID=UPI00077BAF72|nr:uncharacterized protein LOC107371164 isoform X2 [Tetranychus urticae]
MLGSKSLYELHNNSLLCHSVNHQHLQNDNNLNGKNNISHSNSHVYLPVTPNDTHLCPLYAQVVYLSDESDIENAKQPNDSHVTVNVSADESDSSTEFVHPEATNLLTNGKTSDNKIEKYNNYTIKPSDIYTDEDVDDIKNDYECNLSTSGSNNPQNPNCRVTPIEVDYLNHHPLPAYLETIFEEDEEGYLSSSSSSSLDTETSSSSAISSPHNDNQSYQVHSQSEEEILSPGEEVETIDSHSHHHSHQQFFSGHHHHHHQHPEAALISCPGTIIIPTRPPERPRFPTQRALHQLSQSSAIGLICDHNQNSENQRRRQENEQEVGITGNCRIEVEQEVEEGEEIEEDLERQEEEEEDDKDRHRGRRRRKKSGQLEDDSHLPPEIPPLPPSPLHHLHHNLYPFHHQLYTNNFTGFPSLEALEEYHRQHHLEHHLHHHHQEHHQNHFHLPLQRSSTLDSPSGGSDFQLPCSPESEDSDMTSVIKGPSYKARAPKNIWSPGSTTSSSSSDLASTPGPVTPGPMTMACATQTTPTRSESLNVIKCATLPHGFRPVKLTQSNHGLDDIVNDGHQQQQLLHEQHMMAPSTTASSPASGALVASSVVTTGDDNSFTVMPSSPSETSVRQPESLVSPVASQSGVPQVNSSSSPPSNQPRTPSEQGETSSDVPSAPAEPPTPPITIKGINKYWTLPRQSSSSSATGVGSYPEMHHPSQESFLSQSYPNDPNISSVVTDKAPPQNAKFLYETPTAKYYTLPTSQTEVRSIVVPPPLKYEGIGPVNESGVPVSLRSGVKDEYGSDWYKTMYKRLHKCDRPRSELDQPIRVKLKSSRSRDRMDPDYFSEDENTSRVPPRNIADYEPGRSSISLREKHKDSSSETNEDLVNRVINANQNHHHRPRSLEDTHRRHTISKRDLHHKNCVFNALTSPNGYESDSSYIIKKKEPKSAPNPASRSTYCAIQRGDMDIPFSGLQKPAPAPRAHKAISPTPSVLTPAGWHQLASRESSVEPPRRPPTPLHLNDIENWQKQINDDFNYIYKTLEKTTSSSSKSITPIGIDSPTQATRTTTNLPPDYYNQYDENQGMQYKPTSPITNVIRSSTYTESLDSTQTWTDYVNQSSQPPPSLDIKRSPNEMIDHDNHYTNKSTGNLYFSPGRQQLHYPDYSIGKKEKGSLEANSEEIERLINEIESSVNFDEALRESPHRFDEGQVNIHYKTPIQTLVKGEGHPFNIDDLTKFQREMARIHSGNDYDRNYSKESQRKHHFTPNQQSIVHLDRYQKAFAQKAGSYSSHLLARVLFDFHALSSREISAKKGDIVIIHRPVNHHWVEVEDSQSGLKGLVPRSYLDYEQEGIAKAKFDFDAKTAVEISFKKGDVLKLIRKVDENWYEGINEKGLMGIFPCSYVETLKTPLYIQLNNNLTNNQSNCNTNTANGSNQYPSSSSASRLTSNIAPTRGSISSSSSHHHHQQQQQHHLYHPQYEKQHQGEQHSPPRPISPIIGFNGINSSSSSQPPPPPPTANTTPYNRRRDMLNELSATGSNGIKSKLYRVIYPYKPRQVDELELFPGDLLAVSMHCDDGWFVGYSALTGNYGTFPGNYVEPLM